LVVTGHLNPLLKRNRKIMKTGDKVKIVSIKDCGLDNTEMPLIGAIGIIVDEDTPDPLGLCFEVKTELTQWAFWFGEHHLELI
jgi:hypothetical protein